MNVVLIGSAGRCGIHEYSQILLEGFRQLGHRARYIGVRRHDNQDLAESIRSIEDDDELIVFEYEPGIFWLGGLIQAMAWLRFGRRKRVLLSVHEIAAEKYPEFHRIRNHLTRPLSRRGLLGIVQLLASAFDVLLRFLMLRGALLMLGRLPHAVLIHSPKAAENIRLILANDYKTRYIPLVSKRLEGDKRALRERLGLPQDVFSFIIPGFLFRRKRIIEVIKQLPAGAELWIVGTPSEYEPGYLEEIEEFLAHSEKSEQVRLSHDYDTMEQYLLAADVVVLFYSDVYQSATASLAVGAGKPCVFSDLPAFRDLQEAGLTARTATELHQTMVKIQGPDCYRQLVAATQSLRERFNPKRIAGAYLQCLSPRAREQQVET